MLFSIEKAYARTYQAALRAAVTLFDWSPPRLLRGSDCVLRLPEVIRESGVKKVLLVTGPHIWKSGLAQPLCDALERQGVAYAVFAETQANPTIENVEAAYARYRENGCSGVVAFGGGSPMDCAKLAAARAANPETPVAKMRGMLKIRHKLPPLFAVPTTAGTGSEATVAAVVTDAATHEKYAVSDLKLRPLAAVLDPKLTVGLPAAVPAATGMDALTHAVEAYIGRSNTKETASHAEQAVKLIFENLDAAYTDGENLYARDQMLYASYLAGLSFTRAYVGYVHAIAHALGGLYGVPHGLANAVILPYVLDWFGASVYAPLARLAKQAGLHTEEKTEEEQAKLFIHAIRRMNGRLGIPAHLDMIRREDITLITRRALREAHPSYPVPAMMQPSDCRAVLERIMGIRE